MENPMGSYLWRQANVAAHVLPHSWALNLHQCAFGARWRKSTRIVIGCPTESGNLAINFPDRLRCHGKH
eukprot:8955181-Pyramimonas_sp.AAC.1